MSDQSAQKEISPFQSWKSRFRQDFRFDPGSWVSGLSKSLAAVPYTLVAKLPARTSRWFRQLIRGPNVVDGPLDTAAAQSGTLLGNVGLWLAFFLLRTLDLVSAGEAVNFLEHIFKINTRAMTPQEIAEAKRVFGDSLDYWTIRIDEWSLLADVGEWSYLRRTKQRQKNRHVDMAMTLFNTIHFTRRLQTGPDENDMDWLVHELTHVAQHEHTGAAFWVEALIAQGRQGYDYGGPKMLSGRDLADFNREQQGDIVKHYYQILTGDREVSEDARADYERMIGQLREGKL